MPPQDPNTKAPETPPTPPTPPTPDVPETSTPPSPAPEPPTDSPTPSTDPLPADPVSAAPSTGGSKSKMITMFILIAAAVIVLGLGGWFGYNKLFGNNLKLETYSNDSISMLVPVGYEKTEENGGATWTEKGESDKDQSAVVAYYQAYPQTLTDEEVQTVKDTLKSELQDAAKGVVSNSGGELKDLKVTEIQFKGEDAFKLTATAVEDGKKVGDITFIAATTDKAVYVLGVAAHSTDPGLAKKTNDILNSFTLKS